MGNKSYNLKVNEELVLIKNVDYYLAGNNDQFIYADKKNVLKLFSKQKNTITTFLEKNLVNFSREEYLVRLFIFLQGL